MAEDISWSSARGNGFSVTSRGTHSKWRLINPCCSCRVTGNHNSLWSASRCSSRKTCLTGSGEGQFLNNPVYGNWVTYPNHKRSTWYWLSGWLHPRYWKSSRATLRASTQSGKEPFLCLSYSNGQAVLMLHLSLLIAAAAHIYQAIPYHTWRYRENGGKPTKLWYHLHPWYSN